MDRKPIETRLQTQHKAILVSGGKVHFEPLYNMVRLNDVIDIVNVLRSRRGKRKVAIRDFVRTAAFVNAILATETLMGLRKFNDTNNVVTEYKPNGEIMRYNLLWSSLVRTIKGGHGGGGTFVHPFAAISAISHLDKLLANELYQGLLDKLDFNGLESVIAENLKPSPLRAWPQGELL
jgi:hypothetical protein